MKKFEYHACLQEEQLYMKILSTLLLGGKVFFFLVGSQCRIQSLFRQIRVRPLIARK